MEDLYSQIEALRLRNIFIIYFEDAKGFIRLKYRIGEGWYGYPIKVSVDYYNSSSGILQFGYDPTVNWYQFTGVF